MLSLQNFVVVATAFATITIGGMQKGAYEPKTPPAVQYPPQGKSKAQDASATKPSLRWTDAEARERWRRDVPAEVVDDMRDPIRTKYYIILTNSSGGELFGRKMDECYEKIRKVFPFKDVENERLLPVFLFKTREQYIAYFAKIAGITLEEATRSGGHAWKDYYATAYAAPNDPVHIHEAAHQVFANRLHLGGGGSWFQEGVAVYVERPRNTLTAIATQIKKGKGTPLVVFVQIPSLLMSAAVDIKGGNEAGDHYSQAGLFMEFLAESKFGKSKFQEFVKKIGKLRRSVKADIEAVFQEVYKSTIAQVDAEFVKYCAQR